MTDRYILDSDGNPIPCDDMTEWALWMTRPAARILAQDTVGAARVSTVFLGLDHSFGPGGLPILWETMIFGGPHDGYQERYTSRASAKEGHADAVKMAQEGLQ